MSDDENQSAPSPGLRLKQARERLGLSINDVSTATKINPGVLRALEEGRMEDLPPRTFTRGFVRSYAQYLKLDPTPLVQAFDLEDPFISSMGKDSGEQTDVGRTESSSSDFNAASLGPRVLLVAGIIALILMIVGVKSVVDKYTRESIPPETAQTASGTEIISPEDELEDEESEAAAEAIADAVLADDPFLQDLMAKKKAAAENVEASEEEKVPPTAEPTAVPTAIPTAKPTPTPTPTPKPTPTPQPTPTPKPTPTPTPEKEKESEVTPAAAAPPTQHEVIVEAIADVEMEVSLDGGRDQDVEMKSGTLRVFKAYEKVELEIEDAGAVNLIYNGRSQGSPGASGKSVDIKFPK